MRGWAAIDTLLFMIHVAIAAATSVAVILMAIFATVPNYHWAPFSLLPLIWGIYLLRGKLSLRPWNHLLVDSAVLLHMLGAFGFYQKSPLPFSYDILVHYYFALLVALALHAALKSNYPLAPWQLNVMTLMFMMGLGALHEIMEYITYLVLGEQGGMLKPSTSYFFDTQRDLLNNLLGAITALLLIRLIGARREHPSSDRRQD